MNIILKGQLSYMNQFFEITGITSYDEKHFNNIRTREGIRMIPISISRTISPVEDVKSFYQLYKLFRSERPNIVHTHTPKAGLLGMVAARIANVPIRIHTIGGMPLMEVKGFKRKLLEWTEKLTYKCANMVYPNSMGLKSFILDEKFCHEQKVKVLANGGSNGIDTKIFSRESLFELGFDRNTYRNNLGIGQDDFVYFFCGRIAKEKGIVELVDAFTQLQKKYKVKLLLIGLLEKDYGILPSKVVVEIEANPDIIHPGRADDVRPYYAIADVFVLPTYREGFPNSVLEAGSMELPQIVTDINGCNEIVEHQVNGLLIEPKNTVVLKNAMETLLIDTNMREKLADNARKVIIEKFQCEKVWSAIYDEYTRLLDEDEK